MNIFEVRVVFGDAEDYVEVVRANTNSEAEIMVLDKIDKTNIMSISTRLITPKTKTNFKESKHWDLDISLKELILNNKDCRINMNYRRHKSDDNLGTIIIYLTHPNHNDKPYDIEIGIAEDGFVYIGNGVDVNNSKIFPINRGLVLLEKYGKFINSISDLEAELGSIVEEDCVNISFMYNYSKPNSNNCKFTFINK